MKWTQHINNIVNKANNTLASLRRNLRIKSSDLKATAYKTLVRPIVEYASSVWDPRYKQPNSPNRNGAKKSCKIHSQSLPQYIKHQQYQCCVEDGQAEDKDKAKDNRGQGQGQGLPTETVQGQGQGRTGVGKKSVANLQISTRNTKYNI